jgi:LacI family transcriptional regulator
MPQTRSRAQSSTGSRATTLKDVARHAAVSTATASHVINGTRKVSEDTRERVLAAIETLGYAGHSIARSLRRGRTGMIGLVVSDVENPLFAMLVGHVQRSARQHGFQVIFGNSEENAEQEREIIDAFCAQRVDGIIIAPVSRTNAARLAGRHIPVAVVNRRLVEGDLPHVVVDDEHGAALGLDHLWSLGHRRIAILHGDPTWSTTIDRLKGVRSALRRRGVTLDADLLIQAARPGAAGEAALVDLLQGPRRPTAMLALSNSATLAAIRALHGVAARCPEDVSLVGYGVSSPYSIPISSLSMVEQPVAGMADAAVRLLLAQIAQETVHAPIVLRPTLTPGASSTAVATPVARRVTRR